MAELPASWRDHDDEPTSAPPPPGPEQDAFYAAIGDFQGATYARNAFALATDEEVAALAGRLGLARGEEVLDVGCGDGRHLREAAASHGVGGLGVDVSEGLIAAARTAAAETGLRRVRFTVGDARDLDGVVEPGSVDAAWSLHQGALGTDRRSDAAIVAGMAAALRPGGRIAVTLFHALFAARHLVPGDALDPVHLVHHHRPDVHGPDDRRRSFDVWTAAYTVPGAVALLEDAGLAVVSVDGAEPGRYDGDGVALDDPELLVTARRPG